MWRWGFGGCQAPPVGWPSSQPISKEGKPVEVGNITRSTAGLSPTSVSPGRRFHCLVPDPSRPCKSPHASRAWANCRESATRGVPPVTSHSGRRRPGSYFISTCLLCIVAFPGDERSAWYIQKVRTSRTRTLATINTLASGRSLPANPGTSAGPQTMSCATDMPTSIRPR